MKEYSPTPYAKNVLVKGKILGSDETPQMMFDRVVNTLFDVEEVFGVSKSEINRLKDAFGELMADSVLLPGTPTLTNAGRIDHTNTALSSCVVIPVDLRDKNAAGEKIRSYYQQNMGSGFDFTPYSDPVSMLRWLNQFSADESSTGKYDRYIGNMGNLHVTHPKIREFISAKTEYPLRHFNISIDVNEEFMSAALNHESFVLANGTHINPTHLLEEIAQCAWQNGDPGIIYLDRMNHDNPVEFLSPYTSTPPCSEMGLAPGETCQFGYLNLAKFIRKDGIDYSGLMEATTIMTRALDNAIEVSMRGYPDPQSKQLAVMKRKIGIGVCGLADALIIMGIPYESEQARIMARDLLSLINYSSKVASVQLACDRGPCTAMQNFIGNKYYDGYIKNRYSQGTNTVSPQHWEQLDQEIKKTGRLRNILTTALPPTGRASILLGSVSSIEPPFSVGNWNDETKIVVNDFVRQNAGERFYKVLSQAEIEGSFQNTDLPNKQVLKTAKEIHPFDHLRMVAALCGKDGVYDEAASKTVNLPKEASIDDVMEIFIFAHQLGLKNISVYRDGSHENQPQKL